MFEFTITRPELDVQETEYLRLLGFPRGHVLDGRSRELADWARRWYAENGRPWIVARAAGGMEIEENSIRLSNVSFSSARLCSQFSEAEAHDAWLVAVSAGDECEAKARECWNEGKPDEYFFLEMFGSAVVEHLVTLATGKICAWADQNEMAVLPHYSPGYAGWPISEQRNLFHLIRSNAFPGPLEVLDTGMLRPKKSLLAVFGLTRHREKIRSDAHLVPCENCSLQKCQYRRVPYRVAMPQPEVFTRPANLRVGIEFNGNGHSALDLNASYTVNSRALRKWANERLHLDIAAEGSVHARFRYEGTTCSNLGVPILYDHFVRLRSAEENYLIEDLYCAPAAGDVGHDSQCEFLKDAEGFMRRIAADKPLLNRPLNDVLRWKRQVNPAGCYCEAASREHKWGIVLEVLHFALAQRQILRSTQTTLISPKQESLYDQAV